MDFKLIRVLGIFGIVLKLKLVFGVFLVVLLVVSHVFGASGNSRETITKTNTNTKTKY